MSEMSCININFDSLGWSLSTDPKDFLDPTFFEVADRFFELSDKHDFKYTIFVVGKDLENPQVAKRVREWSRNGHEIGNHSYNHMLNLGSLPYSELEKEIMSSHEIITKIIGKEPRGFIAPAWATSNLLVEILTKHGYLYDTSTFPSIFSWFLVAKIWQNFKNDVRRSDAIQRKDFITNIVSSRRPYFSSGKSTDKELLILPLPVTRGFRIPCWHTMSFFMPHSVFNGVLGSCLREKYFYYLIHPADLLDRNDIPLKYRDVKNVERVDISLEKKMKMMRLSLQTIMKRSQNIVTLREIADEIYRGSKNEDSVVSK